MSVMMSNIPPLEDAIMDSAQLDLPFPVIEATDLSSLLSQFEEASQSLDGLSTPPQLEPEPVLPTPPALKSKSEELKTQTKSPVITPPATPPPEVLARIRAKRKRKLAIMLPTLLPAKVRGQSNGSRPAEQGDAKTAPSSNKTSVANVSQDYYEHIPDHDYCVNSPKLAKADCSMFLPPVGGEVVLEAGDTSVVDADLDVPNNTEAQELEEGEVPESPVQKIPARENTSDISSCQKKSVDKCKKFKRSYRKRESSPVHDNEQYFDKIPAYFTTLSKPVKPAKKDKVEGENGIRREDFIERDTSPSRPDSSVFDKLPAYYSCFTNSTRYDNHSDAKDSFDLDDLDEYPCAKKPRRYKSRSRSRSRSYSRSRSRSYSRSRSHRGRRSSYSSASGSSSSRSRSRSRSSSCSSRSRSRSRSYTRSYRSYSRSSSRGRSCSSRRHDRNRYRSYSRSSSRSRSRSNSTEKRRQERKEIKEKEKARQIEERRIMYVGKIPDGYTRRELRKRFGRFGDIEEVSVHFREYGDNYGFVTFAYTCDAYAAIEKGNDIPGEKRFDLCFGGRRQFCDTDYADLDGNKEIDEEFAPLPAGSSLDFDQLLKQAKQSQKSKR